MPGQAALAMWWDMAPEWRDEFEHWHSHEHFPERLRIPGFRRGSRWASAAGDDGFFVMYELEAYATLTSPHYRQRLDNPTPWSVKMMPEHRNMVRSQCRIVESCGGGVGGFYLASSLGLSKQTFGTCAWGFVAFSVLCFVAVTGLALVKTRWRTTWGALSGARI